MRTMSLKYLTAILGLSLFLVACNTAPSEKEVKENSTYVAIVDSSMTLLEVAKANNIGEPYLRTKLGIKEGIGKSYTINKMSKMFDFEIDELKQIIEDRKNKQRDRRSKKKKPTNKK